MAVIQWTVVEAQLDPVIGSEQSGVRPVLVVSNNEFNQVIPNATVLPLTSTQRRLYPSEVLLPQGVAGQPRDSIVLAHQIRTISQQRLGRSYGALENTALQNQVQQAIKEHLSLS
jgi:mRNA interferase MazF